MASEPRELILLFDGLCPLCNAAVRFILARDRAGVLRIASLQGDTARRLLARQPAIAGVDSLVLVETGKGSEKAQVWIRSEAVLRIAEYLGGRWRAARVLRMVPRFLRDAAYDVFARLRYRVFGRYAACPAPDPAVRVRFLP